MFLVLDRPCQHQGVFAMTLGQYNTLLTEQNMARVIHQVEWNSDISRLLF